MIDESIDHALDDMDGRVFTEAKLKADELLPALDEALAICGENLDTDSRQSIEEAKVRVLSAIASNNGKELKTAVQSLDEATEELASLVMQSLLA